MMPTPNVAAKNIVSRDERARSMTQNDIQGTEREEATFIIRGERRDGEIVTSSSDGGSHAKLVTRGAVIVIR